MSIERGTPSDESIPQLTKPEQAPAHGGSERTSVQQASQGRAEGRKSLQGPTTLDGHELDAPTHGDHKSTVEQRALEEAWQSIVDYAENAELNSMQFKAFEHSVNQRWSITFPDRRVEDTIDPETIENELYKLASNHVNGLLEDYTNHVHISMTKTFGSQFQTPRPVVIMAMSESAKELVKLKNRIKQSKIQQPQPPTQQ